MAKKVVPGGKGLRTVRESVSKVYRRNASTKPAGRQAPRGKRFPIVLICGQPSASVMKNEIIPALQYYHHRSGDLFDIFLMGYHHRQPVKKGKPKWSEVSFSAVDFAKAVKDIERQTKWIYSGQTDLIFLATSYQIDGEPTRDLSQRAKLHFDFAVSLCLESAIESKQIPSASFLLEEITRATVDQGGADVVGQISTILAGRAAKKGFVAWLTSLLKIDAGALQNFGSSLPRNLNRARG